MKKRIFAASSVLGAAGLYTLNKLGDRDIERKRSIARIRTGKLEYREPDTEDYYTVFPDLTKLDYNFARRFNTFQTYMTHNYIETFGRLEKEYDEQNQLKPLFVQPDALPVKLKPGVDPKNLKNVDWGNLTPSEKKKVAQNFESIKARRVSYKKPIAIIYNPNSGKKRQIRPKMEERLKAANIPYEMMPTQKAFDTFEFAYSIDLNKYSAILAVGGDGSYYEVVNGMLMREDGLRLPVGIVPNGSGNSVGFNLGIESVDEAMDTVIAATATKFDIMRVLADTESVGDVPPGKAGYGVCRYGLTVISGGWVPNLIDSAIPLKPYLGKGAYLLQFIKMMAFSRPQYQYDAEIDGQKVPNQDGQEHSIVADAFGFYVGQFIGFSCISPFSSINDGLTEMEYNTRVVPMSKIIKNLHLAEQGRLHYEQTENNGLARARGKQIKLTFQGIKGAQKQKGDKAPIIIDGELFEFENTLIVDSVPDGVEYLFDHKQYFKDFGILKE